MDSIALESVSKVFRHRPSLFNWMGRERSGETRALDDISLNVASGRVLVLLGPNGSGKTTTLKLVSTMLLPDAGRVLVEGADTRTQADQEKRRLCSCDREVIFPAAISTRKPRLLRCPRRCSTLIAPTTDSSPVGTRWPGGSCGYAGDEIFHWNVPEARHCARAHQTTFDPAAG